MFTLELMDVHTTWQKNLLRWSSVCLYWLFICSCSTMRFSRRWRLRSADTSARDAEPRRPRHRNRDGLCERETCVIMLLRFPDCVWMSLEL